MKASKWFEQSGLTGDVSIGGKAISICGLRFRALWFFGLEGSGSGKFSFRLDSRHYIGGRKRLE